MARVLLFMFILFIGTVLSTQASAQVPAKSIRLNLDTNIVKFNIGGWNPSGPEDWRLTKLEGGIGNPNLALGIGVTVIDALAIGIRVSIAQEKESVEFDEDDSDLEEEEVGTDFDAMEWSVLRWGVAPYLEYAFGNKIIRPFIMVLLGFEGHKEEKAYRTSNFWDFVLGLGGGIHLFANPSVSVDVTILLGFSAGGGSIKTELPDAPDDEDSAEMKFSRVLFRMTGGLGLSGWF